MHTTLPALVLDEDIGLFYTLLGQYHADPERFRTFAREFGKGNEERPGQPECPPADSSQEIPNLYAFVAANCSCGGCYKQFARTDRVPWRSVEDSDLFVNAKHGTVFVGDCPVRKFVGMGYIYVEPKQFELDDKLYKKGVQLKREAALADHEEDLRKETLEKSRLSTTLLAEKRQSQHASQAGELAALEQESTVAYAKYHAKIQGFFIESFKTGGFKADGRWNDMSTFFQKSCLPENQRQSHEHAFELNYGKKPSELRNAIKKLYPYQFEKQKELETLRIQLSPSRGKFTVRGSNDPRGKPYIRGINKQK